MKNDFFSSSKRELEQRPTSLQMRQSLSMQLRFKQALPNPET